jgi:hypothetical protein
MLYALLELLPVSGSKGATPVEELQMNPEWGPGPKTPIGYPITSPELEIPVTRAEL